MTHVSYIELGKALLSSWGEDVQSSPHEVIANMPAEQRTYCIVSQLVVEALHTNHRLEVMTNRLIAANEQLQQLRHMSNISRQVEKTALVSEQVRDEIRKLNTAVTKGAKSPPPPPPPPKEDEVDPEADAALEWLTWSKRLVRIEDLDSKGLSSRARDMLAELKVVFVHELTKARLQGLERCGLATQAEILDWVERIM